MAEVPGNVLSAFDDLASAFSSGGSKLSGAWSAETDKVVAYRPEIAARLSAVSAKLSPGFLSDFLSTVRNDTPAAQEPANHNVPVLQNRFPLGLAILGAVLVVWGLSRGR